MNDEVACQKSIVKDEAVARRRNDDAAVQKDEAEEMRHAEEAGKVALDEALFAESSLIYKEDRLFWARTMETPVALRDSGADDATRKEARQIIDSAAKELAALRK